LSSTANVRAGSAPNSLANPLAVRAVQPYQLSRSNLARSNTAASTALRSNELAPTLRQLKVQKRVLTIKLRCPPVRNARQAFALLSRAGSTLSASHAFPAFTSIPNGQPVSNVTLEGLLREPNGGGAAADGESWRRTGMSQILH